MRHPEIESKHSTLEKNTHQKTHAPSVHSEVSENQESNTLLLCFLCFLLFCLLLLSTSLIPVAEALQEGCYDVEKCVTDKLGNGENGCQVGEKCYFYFGGIPPAAIVDLAVYRCCKLPYGEE